MRRRAVLIAAALAAVAAAPAFAVPPAPIPEGPEAGSLPVFLGAPAAQQPVEAADPPRHPFMAPNGRSNLHVDAYQTDVHQGPGPLGRDMRRVETFLPDRPGLPHRPHALQAPGRRGARPQQQLRTDHAGACAPRRRGGLHLRVRRLRSGKLRLRVVGAGTRQVRRVTFHARGKRIRRDARRPFKATVARRRQARRTRIVARILRDDGTRAKRARRARAPSRR